MRALVTGARGFLGRHVVAELLRRGDEVTALVRPSAAESVATEMPGVEVLAADLRRPPADLGDRAAATDTVFHLAAGAGGGWRATFDTNVLATENLLSALRAAGWRGRLVHVSSFSVYGLNQLRPGARVDESVPLEPHPERRDDYAWTKLLQERVVRRAGERPDGPELVIVRPGAIYGPERRFQPRLGRQVGRVVVLIGGANPMPLTYVENTASLIVECGHHPAAAGRTFNAVDRDLPSQFAYLRHWLRSEDGTGGRVLPVPFTALRAAGASLELAGRLTGGAVGAPSLLDRYRATPMFRRFDWAPSAAERELGWRPPVAPAEALRRTFA